MSKFPAAPEQPSRRKPIWTVPNIAVAIDRTERATYHALESGQIPGARKIAGRWALDLDVFYAAFRAEAATLPPPPY